MKRQLVSDKQICTGFDTRLHFRRKARVVQRFLQTEQRPRATRCLWWPDSLSVSAAQLECRTAQRLHIRHAEHWERRDIAKSGDACIALDAQSATYEKLVAVAAVNLSDKSRVCPRLEFGRLGPSSRSLRRKQSWCSRLITDKRMLSRKCHG